MERPLQEQRTATTIPPPEREVPDFPQLPQDQQWEYATLIGGQTAGFFGVIGAKQSVQWSSTLEDEGQSNFEQSATDLFYRIGRAGWELITSTTMTRSHGGTTHESIPFR